MPAPELVEWIDQAYLAETGQLFTPEHGHLVAAKLACLWTNCENSRRQQRIVGQAEMPASAGARSSKWARGRVEFQLEQWFGDIPDFLLTFDALYANDIDDATFCSLVDHELFHCAQATDEFHMPKFNKVTGDPSYCIRGHDIEEFVGVVRRFGIQAAAGEAVEFVIAASQKPEIASAALAQACGTCLRLAA
ncbi:MAG: hypothetical protein IIB77_05365 [Proteobacteria bacterium]|nr:hypothetical protein [Pseudomonadota bacterium]